MIISIIVNKIKIVANLSNTKKLGENGDQNQNIQIIVEKNENKRNTEQNYI